MSGPVSPLPPERPRHETEVRAYPGVTQTLWRWECACSRTDEGFAGRYPAQDAGDRHVLMFERDEARADVVALRAQVEAAAEREDRRLRQAARSYMEDVERIALDVAAAYPDQPASKYAARRLITACLASDLYEALYTNDSPVAARPLVEDPEEG